MKPALIVLVVLLAMLAIVLLVLGSDFARRIAKTEARLTAIPAGEVRADLPPALSRFAERGLAGDQPAPSLHLTQAAEMRLKPGADWTPLVARQTIAGAAPGFAWVAAMKLGPLPLVRVIDSYVDGRGRLEVRGLGAWPMGTSEGPDATLGEAQRYLAELPWFPDAILTNSEIAWTETPEGATARLDTPGGPAEVRFTIDAAGDITAVAADARPTTLADGTAARLPWRGVFSDYGELCGRRIPRSGEVGYDYPDGYESYWRGRITGCVLGGR